MELRCLPDLAQVVEWFDELVLARLQWQNKNGMLLPHSLQVLSWLPVVLLPLLSLELSQQLSKQSSERVELEGVDVELVEAATVKLEESKAKRCPGLVQRLQAQVKRKNPLHPLRVKKSQLLVKLRMSTNHPNSEVPHELRAVRGGRHLAALPSRQTQNAPAQLLSLPIQRLLRKALCH